MYDEERDAYADAHRGAPGCIFALIWFVWVVVNVVAFTAGDALGQSVRYALAPELATATNTITLEGRVEATGPLLLVPMLAGALTTGAVIGIAQGLVLLPFMKLLGTLEWTAATIVGWVVRWIAAFAVARTMVGLVLDWDIVGACLLVFWMIGLALIAGGTLGFAQAIVLRRRVHHPEWWVATNLAGPLIAAWLLSLSFYFEGENLFRGFLTPVVALFTGMSTGVALLDFLRHPTTQAEWTSWLGWRRERKLVPQQETVLGSSLYEAGSPQPYATESKERSSGTGERT
jgi:hypothetical protein